MANYSASDITTDEQSALDQVSEETSAAVKYDIAAKKAKDPATRDAMIHNKNDEIEHAGLMGKVAAEENPEVKEKMMDGVKEYDSIVKKSISQCIKDRVSEKGLSTPGVFTESFKRKLYANDNQFVPGVKNPPKSLPELEWQLKEIAKTEPGEEALKNIGGTVGYDVVPNPVNEEGGLGYDKYKFNPLWNMGGHIYRFMTPALEAAMAADNKAKVEEAERVSNPGVKNREDVGYEWYTPPAESLQDKINTILDTFLNSGLEYDVVDRSVEGNENAPLTDYEKAVAQVMQDLDRVMNEEEQMSSQDDPVRAYDFEHKVAPRFISPWTEEDEKAYPGVWNFEDYDPSKEVDMKDWHIKSDTMPALINRANAFAKRDYASRLAQDRLKELGYSMTGDDITRGLKESMDKAGWLDKRLKSTLLMHLVNNGLLFDPEKYKDILGDELFNKAVNGELTEDALEEAGLTDAMQARFKEKFLPNYAYRNLPEYFRKFGTGLDLYNYMQNANKDTEGFASKTLKPKLARSEDLMKVLLDNGLTEENLDAFHRKISEQIDNGEFNKNPLEATKKAIADLGLNLNRTQIGNINAAVAGSIENPASYVDTETSIDSALTPSQLMYGYNLDTVKPQNAANAQKMLDFMKKKGYDMSLEYTDLVDTLEKMADLDQKRENSFDNQGDAAPESIYNDAKYKYIQKLMEDDERDTARAEQREREEYERATSIDREMKAANARANAKLSEGYEDATDVYERQMADRDQKDAFIQEKIDDARETLQEYSDIASKNRGVRPKLNKEINDLLAERSFTLPSKKAPYTNLQKRLRSMTKDSWLSDYTALITDPQYIEVLNRILQREAPEIPPIQGRLYSPQNKQALDWLDNNGYLLNAGAESGVTDDESDKTAPQDEFRGGESEFQTRLANAISSIGGGNMFGALDFLENFPRKQAILDRIPKDANNVPMISPEEQVQLAKYLDIIDNYRNLGYASDAAKGVKDIADRASKLVPEKSIADGEVPTERHKAWVGENAGKELTRKQQHVGKTDEDKEDEKYFTQMLTSPLFGKDMSVLDALKGVQGFGDRIASTMDVGSVMPAIETAYGGVDFVPTGTENYKPPESAPSEVKEDLKAKSAGRQTLSDEEKASIEGNLKKLKAGSEYKKNLEDVVRRMSLLMKEPNAMVYGGSDNVKIDPATGKPKPKGTWAMSKLASMIYGHGALERDERNGRRNITMIHPTAASVEEMSNKLSEIEKTLGTTFTPDQVGSDAYMDMADKLVTDAFGDVTALAEPENYAPHLVNLISNIYDKSVYGDDGSTMKKLKALSTSMAPEDFIKIAEPMYQTLEDQIKKRDEDFKGLMESMGKQIDVDKLAGDHLDPNNPGLYPDLKYRYTAEAPIRPGEPDTGWKDAVIRDIGTTDFKTGLPRNIDKIAPLQNIEYSPEVMAALDSVSLPTYEEFRAEKNAQVDEKKAAKKEKEGKAEEEKKEAKPVKITKSATESKCTRVRRRSDADPLPDDTGGLTEKDLKEPKIHDDAEGSSVKHMGDSVIKKSTSELMKERFNRRR